MTWFILFGRLLIPPFYVCTDPYVISADIFLRMRGKFTIICAFQLRVFKITFTGKTRTLNSYRAHDSYVGIWVELARLSCLHDTRTGR